MTQQIGRLSPVDSSSGGAGGVVLGCIVGSLRRLLWGMLSGIAATVMLAPLLGIVHAMQFERPSSSRCWKSISEYGTSAN